MYAYIYIYISIRLSHYTWFNLSKTQIVFMLWSATVHVHVWMHHHICQGMWTCMCQGTFGVRGKGKGLQHIFPTRSYPLCSCAAVQLCYPSIANPSNAWSSACNWTGHLKGSPGERDPSGKTPCRLRHPSLAGLKSPALKTSPAFHEVFMLVM